MIKDVVLTTDLYHRHGDPNDHFNLAALYALDKMGLINLVGILCDDDKPQPGNEKDEYLHFGDPSVQSVAQMNYITGRSVPVGVGSRRPLRCKEDLRRLLNEKQKISSVDLLLRALENTKTQVDIHMCGSCRDVLIASAMRPELFREKCGGIFLNAGNYGSNDPIEYNVSLEPYSFSQIFNIPCDIYWSPCFKVLTPYPYQLSERGTYYEIEQPELLTYLSPEMKKYFTYMFDHVTDIGWLSFLRKDLTEEDMTAWCRKRNTKRQMWSTPGFLRSAGFSVTAAGDLVPIGHPDAIYGYTPVEVECTGTGEISWHDVQRSHIHMFRNTDPKQYANAMDHVIKKLYRIL